MSDRILGLVGLVVAALYVWQATLIEESFITDVVGPKTFPIILAILMAATSLYFILRPDKGPEWPTGARLFELLMAIAVLVLYALYLPQVGFVIATAIAAGYLTWRLGSRPLASLLIGIATALGIWVVFKLILGLSLAEGPFGF
ncbi:tripartite tricarboxylate transporter TctB family protein [Acuticoccus mangrovi]|uniref:Tripartite tricarboxylate transporter TctB family protein n=1 Tax=Acuticoccus mangrovi TaxID=2796142 RepID=A0A934MHB4_9HYPH|nr:tripartite tricarboxylate transporter TctB family protein [Acuticoccus mangrovi]MBJ3776770.1 tripartite tricarboxylate transporter TctB family protein [Acuticoccus mangrovi]